MWPSVLTLAMTLTLNFQGQIWNLLYLSQKWSDCHETKSKHIDWSQDLKCDHRVWPWTWPWPWKFKVKYGIAISAKNGPIATKRKANTSIELLASNYDHQIWPWLWPWPWIFKVKYEFLYISTKTGHETKSKHIDLNSRPQIWPMSLTLAMTLIFEGHMWSWPFGDQGQV